MADCRTNSPTNFCKTYPDTRCVVYTGPNLLCIDVNTNDRLEEILAKINTAICNGGGGGGTGTVTSIISGDGMDFPTITTTGTVTMGLPSSVTLSSTNSLSATSHTHAFAPGGTSSEYITGEGKLAEFPAPPDAWLLAGNTGTNPTTNFIGTTDNQSLRFKANNLKSGYIDVSANGLTTFGHRAGENYASGVWSTLIGYHTGMSMSVASEVTAIGTYSMWSATATSSVAVGSFTLAYATGIRNVAVGASGLNWTTSGRENSVVGNFGMLANRQGSYNSALGSSVLRGNVKGQLNVGVGHIALTQNTTNILSINVVAGGSGYTTATVVISAPTVLADPNNNSLQATATANIVAGTIASVTLTEPGKGYTDVTDATGTAVTATIVGDGTGAVLSVTLRSGDYNTAVGAITLPFNLAGSYNTALGYGASNDSTYGVNRTTIGALAYSTQDNSLTLGSISGINSATADTLVGIGTTAPRKKLDLVGSDALIYEHTLGRGGGGVSTNVAFGNIALAVNTTGTFNTAIGYQALATGTTGTKAANTAIGALAMNASNANFATAIGVNAMLLGGAEMGVAIGLDALRSRTGRTGGLTDGIVAIGAKSGYTMTTAAINNTLLGFASGYSITTGDNNIGIGFMSMGSGFTILGGIAQLTGDKNVGVGDITGYNITSGSNNTFLGYNTGSTISSGSNNTFLGYNSGASATTVNYSVIIGSHVGIGLTDNQILISDGQANERMRFNISGALQFAGSGDYGTAGYILSSNGSGAAPSWIVAPSGGGGTVTSVAAGAGMNFTTITTTGSVVMGTPSSVTLASTNSASGTTHSHLLSLGGTSAQYLRGDTTLSTFAEDVEDVIGGILTDTATIDLVYNDAGNTITANVIVGSVDNTQNELVVWTGTAFKQRDVSSILSSLSIVSGNVIWVDVDSVNATDTRGSYSNYDFAHPWSTIAAALGVAGDGDTVMVMPGTYTESINLTLTSGKIDIVYWNVQHIGDIQLNGSGNPGDYLTVKLINSSILSGSGYGLSIGGSGFSRVHIYGDNLGNESQGSLISCSSGIAIDLTKTSNDNLALVHDLTLYGSNYGIQTIQNFQLKGRNLVITGGGGITKSGATATLELINSSIVTDTQAISDSAGSFVPSSIKIKDCYLQADSNNVVEGKNDAGGDDTGYMSIINTSFKMASGNYAVSFTSATDYVYKLYIQDCVVENTSGEPIINVPDNSQGIIDVYRNRMTGVIPIFTNAVVTNITNVSNDNTKIFNLI